MDNQMNKQAMTEQDMMTDALSSQKFMTENYNLFANECSSPAIKSELMNILNEEHQIQHEVFSELQKRGWYQVEAADQNKINQAKQKYQNMNA